VPVSEVPAVGTPVLMLGFPQAPLEALRELKDPIAAKGHICANTTSLDVVIADYHGGMLSVHACSHVVDIMIILQA